MSQTDPELAARALRGLARYAAAERVTFRPARGIFASKGAAALRDCGGSGPPVILVPSLINPPGVLDLDESVSLADAVAAMGRRTFLLDWGAAQERAAFGLGAHVTELLLPLIREFEEPPALIGYCLGGTMAIAAANLAPIERVATIATPWRFSAYPKGSRNSLLRLWETTKRAARDLDALPMEVLQSAFWSLDPKRTVAKFASLSELPPGSASARRFITLEDWANEGDPLPYPAARELIEDLFGADLPGKGEWQVGNEAVTDRLRCPSLNITASNDQITPAATRPAGETASAGSGHVGMVVGSARGRLHESLAEFLD